MILIFADHRRIDNTFDNKNDFFQIKTLLENIQMCVCYNNITPVKIKNVYITSTILNTWM